MVGRRSGREVSPRAAQRAAICVASFAGLVVALAGGAAAAPQSGDQQHCLTDLTKAGANVVKQQGKSDWKCLRNATHG